MEYSNALTRLQDRNFSSAYFALEINCFLMLRAIFYNVIFCMSLWYILPFLAKSKYIDYTDDTCLDWLLKPQAGPFCWFVISKLTKLSIWQTMWEIKPLHKMTLNWIYNSFSGSDATFQTCLGRFSIWVSLNLLFSSFLRHTESVISLASTSWLVFGCSEPWMGVTKVAALDLGFVATQVTPYPIFTLYRKRIRNTKWSWS